MNRGSKQFRVQPVAAAVGMALSALFAGQVYAAGLPAANLPVNGQVVAGSLSTTSLTVTGAVGDFGGTSQASGTLTITNASSATVITWGSSSATAVLNAQPSYAGFNIAGPGQTANGTPIAASTVTFTGGGTVLNVDTSGNASMLNGNLTGTGTNVFVANANGIIVGSTATFDLGSAGLALLASSIAGLSSMGSTSTFSQFGVNFAAGGNLTVNDGAKFATTGTVLLAGAGTVNVTDTAPLNSGLNLTIVGGQSGVVALNGTFAAATQASFTNGTSPNAVTLTFALTNAASTAVNLNLGHVTTATQAAQAFTFTSGSAIYATGDVNNATTSNVDLATNTVAVRWGGTFTNNGLLADAAIGGTTTSLYNNFVNAGTLNSAASVAIGGNFTNTGTVVATGPLTISASNVNNSGTLALTTSSAQALSISAVNSVTLGGTVSGSLGTLNVVGGQSTPAQGVTINTALNAAGDVSLSGFNVAVNNSVVTPSTRVYVGVGAAAANAVAGQFTLASGATLGAAATNGNVFIYANSSLAPANASIGGTVSANQVFLGGGGGGLWSLNTVNVGGNIATNNLSLSLTGDINKAAGGGTAANNYLDNAALVTQLSTAAPVNVSLGAYGTRAQRFNIKVAGSASITSATSNFGSSGINNGANNNNGTFTLPAANQLSQLRFQTTGDLFVNGGSGLGISPSGSFTWPGLTVLMAGGNLVSNASIDNALGAVVPGGNGIFLQGNTLQLNAPVYTSGNAWINFLQTGYGTVTTMSPLGMTSYYVATEPSNTSTGVNSYVPSPAPSSQLKTGRAFVTGYVPQ
ncbi:hypothetical protein [Thiomonas sp.]|uniref:beta strand repeat-containing protein n=1 Tax=Thiomonas sp. TaxID=2047785 RepID=UPI00261DECB3|nr:hypothetical protein [Thiomonas sp.]